MSVVKFVSACYTTWSQKDHSTWHKKNILPLLSNQLHLFPTPTKKSQISLSFWLPLHIVYIKSLPSASSLSLAALPSEGRHINLLSPAASINYQSPLFLPSEPRNTNSHFNVGYLSACVWPFAPTMAEAISATTPPLVFHLIFFIFVLSACFSRLFTLPAPCSPLSPAPQLALTWVLQLSEAAISSVITAWCCVCRKWWCMASCGLSPLDLQCFQTL